MPYCYPPDPNTRKPTLPTPPKSCDTHFHVFGPPETFPFVSTHEYTPPAAPLEHYLKMAAVIGIERAVVVQPSVHGLDNSATLDAIAKSDGRFRGVGRIDDKTTKSELQRLHDAGVRGVRFNLLDRPRGNIKLNVLIGAWNTSLNWLVRRSPSIRKLAGSGKTHLRATIPWSSTTSRASNQQKA